jgi:hypothetical protein
LTSEALSRLLFTIPFRKTSCRDDAQGGRRALRITQFIERG